MGKHTKIISLLLSLIMVLSVFGVVPFSAVATETDSAVTGATGGTTGDCTWTLDGTVLTISGNGEMKDYNYNNRAPWGTAITEVILTDGVTSIGEYAFDTCTGLTSITIGNSVTSIGYGAFSGCTGLTSVTIPDSVTSIGNDAFSECTGLTNVKIGSSVKSIGSYAFYRCTGLTSVTIPESVWSIGMFAFSDCEGLTSITIPDSVRSISIYAFYRCTGLTSVNIPDSVWSIGERAFYGCTGLTSVIIPNSVTRIDLRAFGYTDKHSIGAKIDGFTIYGYPGTAAEEYANDNGFTFITPKIGDADGDGQITVMDVTEVQHLLSSMNTKSDEATLMFADVDKNGVLEVIDATFILRYLADIEIPYVIG